MQNMLEMGHSPTDPSKQKMKELDISKIEGEASPSSLEVSEISGLSSRRAIKMKTGKWSLPEVMALLSSTQFPPPHSSCLELPKLSSWIQASQTYIIEFHINDKLSALAFFSPIPSLGMALKFWSPIADQVDRKLVHTLFKKMIDYVEKMTTYPKIMYAGPFFDELQSADFTLK